VTTAASGPAAEHAARWWADARQAWPQLQLSSDALRDYVSARVVRAGDEELLHAADLYLCAACLAGEPTALAAFDEHVIAQLAPVLAQLGLTRDEADEVRQQLRDRLLVADGSAPRLVDYSGRADLRTWVRTAAVRAGIDLLRRRKPTTGDDDRLDALPALADDPELAHLKRRYAGELSAAVAAALAALAPRDRLLLKYAYLDGLTVEQIGGVYGVHRATAARWVAAARDRLSAETHARLSARLGLTPSELRSVARLVESQLDLSLGQLLR